MMRSLIFYLGFLSAIYLSIGAVRAEAESDPEPWEVGGRFGLNLPLPTPTLYFDFGLIGEYKPDIYFGLGAEFSRFAGTVNSIVLNENFVLAQADYFFTGMFSGFSVGLKSGTMIEVGTSMAGVSYATAFFALGPHISYDYKFMDAYSVGLDVSLLFAGPTAQNTWGVTFKYWP